MQQYPPKNIEAYITFRINVQMIYYNANKMVYQYPPKNIEAYVAFKINVRMIYFGFASNFRRFMRVGLTNSEVEGKCTSFIHSLKRTQCYSSYYNNRQISSARVLLPQLVQSVLFQFLNSFQFLFLFRSFFNLCYFVFVFFAPIILVFISFLCNHFCFLSILVLSTHFFSLKNLYFAVATVSARYWPTRDS